MQVLEAMRRAGRIALDAVLPPQCLGCNALVSEPGALCATCWESISFIDSPLCACCGVPFDIDPGPQALCGGCIREPPPFRRARAVFRYDEHGKHLVLRFKHGDRLDMAPTFGRWLARAGADMLAGADVVVPVPLHWTRLFSRRYNQAALLTLALAKQAEVPAIPDALRRQRRTPSQGQLGRTQRQRNVRKAFAVRDERLVVGRTVLLVDDVLTTGATAGECTRVLLAAGATAVDVLTLARVVRAS